MCTTRPPEQPRLSSPTEADACAGGAPATRRDALRLLGGGVALAIVARAATPTLAQEASPAPGIASKEGLYAVLRTRTVKADASIDELTAALREGVLPIVRAIPGFVEYYVIQNFDTRERTGVSIFTDKAGADESTRLVGEFIASEGLADSYEDAEPIVVEGEIVTSSH
jgi:hypothetical protein